MHRVVLVLTTIALLAFAATPALAAFEQGTDGGDRLIGTSGSDTLRGLGGWDYIAGRASADELSGNYDRDRAYGEDDETAEVRCGPGVDTVYVGPRDKRAGAIDAESCEIVLNN